MPDPAPLPLPLKGAFNRSAFVDMPPGFNPPAIVRNFRAFGNLTDQPRGGKRAGVVKTFTRPLKLGYAGQAACSVTRASAIVGTQLGTCRDMGDGTSVQSGQLLGEVWALDDALSMDWKYHLDVTGVSGPADNDGVACAMHPDDEFLAIASNYAVGSDGTFTIARLSTAGAFVWRYNRTAVAGFTQSVERIRVSKLYTWATLYNEVSGGAFLIALRNDTGALAFSSTLGGLANQAVDLCIHEAADGTETLYVAFLGSALGSGPAYTYDGGVGGGAIKAGRWALHFRTGVMKFAIDSTAYGGSVAVAQSFGPQLQNGDDYFDNSFGTTPHGTWRLSEHSEWAPHGGEITGIACDADGNLYIAKRNQGWGPNDTLPEFQPDGNTEGYRTVLKVSPAGELLWSADTDSILEEYDPPTYPFYNDLTFTGDTTPDASVMCIAVDGDAVFVGGRRNAGEYSVFRLRADDGVMEWAANVMDATRSVRSVVVDPVDGNPVFVGDDNTGWTGASGQHRHLWKLSAEDGSILNSFGLSPDNTTDLVSALDIAAGATKLFYVSEYIS